MAAKVDSVILKRTIDSLGKVISRPALTEKLLGRPPFRYLHDIVMEVILINAHRSSMGNFSCCEHISDS